MRTVSSELKLRPACALAAVTLLFGWTIARLAAQQNVQASGAAVNLGSINGTADTWKLGPGYFEYTNARLKSDSGAMLDADTVRANLAPNTNAFQNLIATGHVRVYMPQPEFHRSYTVLADKADYEPGTVPATIVLTGNVRTEVESSFTVGPLVQTGDSATVQLGKAPDYPQIVMNHVHTTFTPSR